MSDLSPGEVTQLLHRWRDGDEGALRDLVPLVHGELRKLARVRMRHERPGQSLQPTELVNELYVRLAGANRVEWRDRAHFLALSAVVMRNILVDRARRKKARHAEDRVSLDSGNLPIRAREIDLLALDEALRELAEVAPRQARHVELRFFGGLTIAETASELGLSEATVKRDWVEAQAWLARALRRK